MIQELIQSAVAAPAPQRGCPAGDSAFALPAHSKKVASKPKEIKFYEADHDLNVDAARKDRHDWLTRQLGLPPG